MKCTSYNWKTETKNKIKKITVQLHLSHFSPEAFFIILTIRRHIVWIYKTCRTKMALLSQVRHFFFVKILFAQVARTIFLVDLNCKKSVIHFWLSSLFTDVFHSMTFNYSAVRICESVCVCVQTKWDTDIIFNCID